MSMTLIIKIKNTLMVNKNKVFILLQKYTEREMITFVCRPIEPSLKSSSLIMSPLENKLVAITNEPKPQIQVIN